MGNGRRGEREHSRLRNGRRGRGVFGVKSGCLLSLVCIAAVPVVACGLYGVVALALGIKPAPVAYDPPRPDVTAPISKKPEPQPQAVVKPLPNRYDYIDTKTQIGIDDAVIDIFSFSGEFDLKYLESFCRDRRSKPSVKGFYWIVIFDDASNAVFPTGIIHTEYLDEPDVRLHIRAIYCWNRVNKYSLLSVYDRSSPKGKTTEIKP